MTSSHPASKPVVTRFAPSPTGFLHIGGARTALFNWLFARHHNGTFLLRIEDTDRARSSQAATDAILEGLTWLGLDWDAEPISQFERAERHAEVARQMVADGTAYRCYATREEIEAARATAKEAGLPPTFHSPWRDASAPADPDAPHVIRLRAPLTGQTTVNDLVQGPVTWENSTLDDLILLRSDGTPTYMLAVVVDDHDMSISHVIRGDDHLTNAARQTLIYQAAGWDLPEFAHIPLIHGPDGAKLSKRHGALGVEAYRDMGYPARAVCNYLARLGWSHGDDEFFTIEQAVQWFSLEQVGKSPARFDFKKLDNLSGQHIRAMTDAEIAEAVTAFVATQHGTLVTPERQAQLLKAAPSLKERAKKIPELAEMAHFILADRPFLPDEKAAEQLDTVSQGMLGRLTTRLQHVSWSQPELDAEIRTFAEEEGLKLGKVAQPLRAALTGRTVSPSVFDVMEIIGKTETLDRLRDATG